MAFDSSVTKALRLAWLGTTPKRCVLPLFLAAIGQAVRCWKALSLVSLIMQFQQDWPKDKKITALQIFYKKLQKIFTLKYAISARQELRSKNNSFRKGKIQGEFAKKLQEGKVIWPNVFQTNGRSGLLEERLAYLQKGRHESLSEKAGFIF